MGQTKTRVALVTGGSRGIGAVTARTLASQGLRVVVNYRSQQAAADAVVASIEAAGGEAIALQADVRDPAEVGAMVDEIRAHWGTVEVLVSNASMPFARKSFRDMTWDEFADKLNSEMLGAFVPTKAVVPGMIENGYGRLIYLATNLARRPRAGTLALGTAKAAVLQFARYLAQELAPFGITANVVSPGTVQTEIYREIPQEQKDRMIANTPLGRLGRAEDVAPIVAFYASEGSGFMTGTDASVNGGLSME